MNAAVTSRRTLTLVVSPKQTGGAPMFHASQVVGVPSQKSVTTYAAFITTGGVI
jgi:hypothetical protein